MRRVLLPLIGISILVIAWTVAVWFQRTSLLPGPGKVFLGIIELGSRGLLIKHLVASLFRVTWGYLAAVLLGVPSGLSLGWWGRAGRAFNPLLQILRPISPLAWIPVSILWFGVGDRGAIFIIFHAA